MGIRQIMPTPRFSLRTVATTPRRDKGQRSYAEVREWAHVTTHCRESATTINLRVGSESIVDAVCLVNTGRLSFFPLVAGTNAKVAVAPGLFDRVPFDGARVRDIMCSKNRGGAVVVELPLLCPGVIMGAKFPYRRDDGCALHRRGGSTPRRPRPPLTPSIRQTESSGPYDPIPGLLRSMTERIARAPGPDF